MIRNCRCCDYCRVLNLDGDYCVECNNPDCEEEYHHLFFKDFVGLCKTQSQAVQKWNQWSVS